MYDVYPQSEGRGVCMWGGGGDGLQLVVYVVKWMWIGLVIILSNICCVELCEDVCGILKLFYSRFK